MGKVERAGHRPVFRISCFVLRVIAFELCGEVPAARRVPRVGAAGPARGRVEGVEDVEHGPGREDAVVGGQPEGQHHAGHADTWKGCYYRLFQTMTADDISSPSTPPS